MVQNYSSSQYSGRTIIGVNVRVEPRHVQEDFRRKMRVCRFQLLDYLERESIEEAMAAAENAKIRFKTDR